MADDKMGITNTAKTSAGSLGQRGWSYKEINALAGEEIANEKGVIYWMRL